jgi:hypothetical protein
MVAKTAFIIDGGHPNYTTSGKCSHRIAAAAAMVKDFDKEKKTLTNTTFS